jgi:hypothetical protein
LDNADKQYIQERLKATEERIIEAMRDMQTEILKGFAAHVDGLGLRLRRLLEIEGKLGIRRK